MIRCDIHGLGPSVVCCPHVCSAVDEGLACEGLDVVCDDYGVGFLVCPGCLAAARQYVKAQTDEELEASAFVYQPECEAHVEEWSAKMNDVNLDGLYRRGRVPRKR